MKKVNSIKNKIISAGLAISMVFSSMGAVPCFAKGANKHIHIVTSNNDAKRKLEDRRRQKRESKKQSREAKEKNKRLLRQQEKKEKQKNYNKKNNRKKENKLPDTKRCDEKQKQPSKIWNGVKKVGEFMLGCAAACLTTLVVVGTLSSIDKSPDGIPPMLPKGPDNKIPMLPLGDTTIDPKSLCTDPTHGQLFLVTPPQINVPFSVKPEFQKLDEQIINFHNEPEKDIKNTGIVGAIDAKNGNVNSVEGSKKHSSGNCMARIIKDEKNSVNASNGLTLYNSPQANAPTFSFSFAPKKPVEQINEQQYFNNDGMSLVQLNQLLSNGESEANKEPKEQNGSTSDGEVEFKRNEKKDIKKGTRNSRRKDDKVSKRINQRYRKINLEVSKDNELDDKDICKAPKFNLNSAPSNANIANIKNITNAHVGNNNNITSDVNDNTDEASHKKSEGMDFLLAKKNELVILPIMFVGLNYLRQYCK